jgi:two-component system phosphate regulon sensor histidine kinase PhoR
VKIVQPGSVPGAGLVLALLACPVVFVVSFLVFYHSLPVERSVLGALIVGGTTSVGVWAIYQMYLARRLEKIRLIFDDIASKNFDDSDVSLRAIRDDLDLLLVQASRTSESVEREINRLKQIENYRKEFIGDVSHELKTPIFAIQGFLEALLSGALEDPSINRVFIRKAMRNVSRLIQLTNDLLEISKLETGELKSNPAPVNLASLVQEVVENLTYKAETIDVTLEADPIDTNLTIWADRNQIRQVLNNIVDNAIKYNREGGSVRIKTRVFPRDQERIEIMVIDTGLGIDPNHIPRLTERFYRVDKSRSRERGGTGLGLSIVKHILETHGEQLFISSVPNEGSTFSFTVRNHAYNR